MVETRGSTTLRRRRSASSSSSSSRNARDDEAEVEPLIATDDKSTGDPGIKGNTKVKKGAKNEACCDSSSPPRRTYHVAKWLILRLLGMVYFVAFLGAYNQNVALMGEDGLVPASSYISRMRSNYDSNLDAFWTHPTLFWWIPLTDTNLDGFAIVGLTLSFLLTVGIDSWLILVMLWLIDFSIVTIAETNSFYSYGWESQLLETGFLAIFLCDLPSIRKVRRGNVNEDDWKWKISAIWRDDRFGERATRGSNQRAMNNAPSPTALWLFRWLCFRISIGAGLIKIRGGSCWKERTCLYYHFETQPIPSPLSFVFHFLPKIMLKHAVDLDLFVQLYSSWTVLIPGLIGVVGGYIQAAFMINIILSGNFAFLNHLTIIPSLASIEDTFWPRWLSSRILRTNTIPTKAPREENVKIRQAAAVVRRLINLIILSLIGYLSIPVIANLLQWGGSHQQMNATFNSFRLVNTYGAFGSVGHDRYEAVISVSGDGVKWKEIEFPCKPGDVRRRPCFCAPYHYRLDWNIWFLGFKPHGQMLRSRETWLYNLLEKVLRGEKGRWLNLLDKSAETVIFGGDRIKYARVDMYHYQMEASLLELMAREKKDLVWWKRKFEEPLVPIIVFDNATASLRRADI